MIIPLFLLTSQIPKTLAEQQPFYTVTLSIPERSISSNELVNVTFSVSGLGSFSNGSILVKSDSKNLLPNSIHYRAIGISQGGVVNLQTLKLPYDKKHAIDAGVNILAVQLSSGEQLEIDGGFQIDTNNLTLGQYRLTMDFFIQTQNQNYVFTDSTTYDKVDFLAANPEVALVINAFLAIVTSTITAYLVARLVKRGRR